MRFWFLLPKDPTATYSALSLKYGDVSLSLRIEDTESSLEDLDMVIEHLPSMVKQARIERDIRRGVAGLDKELTDLFEGDE